MRPWSQFSKDLPLWPFMIHQSNEIFKKKKLKCFFFSQVNSKEKKLSEQKLCPECTKIIKLSYQLFTFLTV